MKNKPFTKAEFIKSALAEKDFPDLFLENNKPFPEIALVGRSNVGKSSLINHLLQEKKLARVSGTPGKTQLLNFFNIDDELLLVDLPGYGFAKVPLSVKQRWGKSLEKYFENRKTLSLVLFLLDIRRTPSDEDLALINWAAFHRKKLLIVFTKVDKVKDYEKKANTDAAFKVLSQIAGLELPPFIHYSIKDPRARMQLIQNIQTLLQ